LCFETSIFVSKVLGISPYSAVGDIGNCRGIVTVSAVICSIGMVILHVGVSPDGVHTAMFTCCISAETVIFLETLCVLHCVLTAPSSYDAGRQPHILKGQMI
jgi:hypothetical protein